MRKAMSTIEVVNPIDTMVQKEDIDTMVNEVCEFIKGEDDSLGYDILGGLYHLFISYDYAAPEGEEPTAIVEPNIVIDGADEPFYGTNFMCNLSSKDEIREAISQAIRVCVVDREANLYI